MKDFIVRILLIALSVFALAEVYYRSGGNYTTYAEKTWGKYSTYYDKVEKSWYHTFSPDSIRVSASSDFSNTYPVNSYGLCNKEISDSKSDTTFRVLTFGDSFIEGVGAPFDSTVPRLLEENLNKKNHRTEVINAGISGSDIFYEYTLYRDKLVKLNPDLILVTINSSDYIDYLQRGGLERFEQDGTTHNRKAPLYEILYHYSHFFRAIIARFGDQPYSGIFISRKEYLNQSENINRKFLSLLQQFNRTAENNGSKLCIVTYAMPVEIFSMGDLDTKNCANLNQLSSWSRLKGMNSINMVEVLKNHFGNKPKEVYAYKGDGHFKPTGYAYMATVLSDSLQQFCLP